MRKKSVELEWEERRNEKEKMEGSGQKCVCLSVDWCSSPIPTSEIVCDASWPMTYLMEAGGLVH